MDPGPTEGFPGGHCARVATAVQSGEHGEVIRVRCGMTGVRVGEAANPGPGQSRSRRVSSLDEGVLVATQWDPSASTRDLEFLSGTVEFSSSHKKRCGN